MKNILSSPLGNRMLQIGFVKFYVTVFQKNRMKVGLSALLIGLASENIIKKINGIKKFLNF